MKIKGGKCLKNITYRNENTQKFNNTTFYKSQQSILITLDIVYQL